MRNLPKRSVACLLTALFLVSVIPPGVAAQDAEEHYTFGIEYDWSNLDVDAETLTGLSIRDILLDVSKAADDSGFVLLLAQETTGTSTIIHDQYTGADTTFKFGGSDVPATPHYTKLTIRHGMMADAAIMTDWSDSSASWDVTLTADSENILVVDMLYVEYRDANNKMMGASMDQSMTFTQGIELGIVGTLTTEAYTDEETQEQHSAQSMPLDASLDMGMTYQIISNHADVVLGAASDLPNVLTQVDAGETLRWDCSSENDESSTDTSEEGYYDDNGDEYMKTTHYVSDSCEELTGSYESKTTVNFDVSGLPAEELGYPVGDWDVSITDSITSSGDYSRSADEGEWSHGSSMELGDSSAQKITIDGTEVSVMQTEDVIIPFGFEGLLAVGIEEAIVGSAETVFDSGLLNDTIFDSWSNDLAEDSSDDHDHNSHDEMHTFTCDDGQIFQMSAHHDIVNDGYENCEDGSDEGISRVKVDGAWDYWGYDPANPSINVGVQHLDDKNSDSNMKNYTMDFSMNSKDMSTSASSGKSDSIRIDAGNSDHWFSLLDMYPEFNFSSMYPDGEIGDTICITVKLYDDTNSFVSEDSDCGWAGDMPPQITSADFESEGSEEFNARFYVNSLNENKDYEVSWKMKESDGSTVDAGSFVVQNRMNVDVYYDCDGDYCESVSGEIDGWGEYCLEIEVNLVGGENNPMATEEVCNDLAQEPEPSQKIISMVGAFMQSTVDNTMESFGENLENRLEKYEADIAYDSAEMYSLWSKEQGRVVGIQLLVSDSDSGNTFTLVGPESNMYPKALSPINVIYFSGTEAIEQEAEIVDDTTIESLVDLTKHNTAAVDAVAVGQDPTNVDTSDGGNTDAAVAVEAAEEKGLLPFISPVATVAMIALAGIFVAVPRKD